MASKKKHPTIVPALEVLNAAYEKAIPLFPAKLQAKLRNERPLIVIQQSMRSKRKVWGWHANHRWKKAKGKGEISEITLVAEQLGEGGLQPFETLIHEMVHHANDLTGVDDVSSNGYHNGKFAELGREVGLVVERTDFGGQNKTSFTPELEKEVKSWGLDTKVFNVYRKKERPERKGSKLKKYECDCGYGIRIAVDPEKVDLTCNICGGQVQYADE